MFTRPSIKQTNPPRSAKETLPTMYDLPSEDPKEPGKPDEFHDLQPQLLSATFRLPDYARERVFTASDLNLYYNVQYPQWYKRPDWFGVVGVSRLYEQRELRLSYVVWQEGVNPFVVVEFLSPGTEKEDLGTSERNPQKPPTKWEVYEQILRVPYYIVYDRYTTRLQAFSLSGGHYQALLVVGGRIWLSELKMGLGLWQGSFEEIEENWLRWYDTEGNWISTDAEYMQQQLERERQRAGQERQRADRLAERLRAAGIDPDEVA